VTLMTTLRYLSNVVTLELDSARCTGCGMCAVVCPHAVFRIEDRRARLADRDACMECGACARNCPGGAIRVRPGVGCAAAILIGAVCGTEPSCACSDGPSCCGG
jgi:NAD-dependent dihydropyrimidine dehydrogenase PreA subunit